MSLLSNLLALHRVDSQVRALRGRVDAAERYLTTQQRQMDDLEAQLQELRTQLRQLHAQMGNLRNEAQSFNERIARIRSELNATTNSRQYNLLLSGLKSTEGQKQEVEEHEKALSDKISQVEAQITALEAQRRERGGLRDGARGELDQRRSDVAERLAELEAERRRAASAIPQADLAIFDRVAALHDGEAMAAVVTISARHREYACSACNCEIPFDSYSRLRSTPDTLVQCINCQRILHMEQVEEAHA